MIAEHIKEAEKRLDELNLLVAHYRVTKGMSQRLIDLYGKMGKQSERLIALYNSAILVDEEAEDLEQTVTSLIEEEK